MPFHNLFFCDHLFLRVTGNSRPASWTPVRANPQIQGKAGAYISAAPFAPSVRVVLLTQITVPVIKPLTAKQAGFEQQQEVSGL